MANPITHGFSAYWAENAAREAANPPKDKPTHAEMLLHGEPFSTAPKVGSMWVIEEGSTGTFIGRWLGEGLFFIEEAGDLWPSKPSHWLSRDRAAEIANARRALDEATHDR